MRNSPASTLDVSVVIPVFNEAVILERAVLGLVADLQARGWQYEIVLAENGSSDGTAALAASLQQNNPRLRVVSTDEPNYGRALKQGIKAAQAPYVLCDEIDLLDLDFHERALALLTANAADLVVGSKVAGGARDERPPFRRFGTLAYTMLLRVLLDFHGTDTHGPKALRRAAILPVVERCVVDRDVFASELVIRATRSGLRVHELPILVAEKRPPSIHLWRRLPNVLRKVWALRKALSVTVAEADSR